MEMPKFLKYKQLTKEELIGKTIVDYKSFTIGHKNSYDLQIFFIFYLLNDEFVLYYVNDNGLVYDYPIEIDNIIDALIGYQYSGNICRDIMKETNIFNKCVCDTYVEDYKASKFILDDMIEKFNTKWHINKK